MEWLSIAEYARNFNVSDMTIRRRIKSGKIHAILKEGKYYISSNEKEAKGHSLNKEMPSAQGASNFITRNDPSYRVQENSHPPPRAIHSPYEKKPYGTNFAKEYHGQRNSEPSVKPSYQQPYSNNAIYKLINSCEEVLSKFKVAEQNLKESYEAKLAKLQSVVALKEQQVLELKQKNEDLEILIQIMEQKS